MLAGIMLILPSKSAENEGHFSMMSLLKDKRRNRMGYAQRPLQAEAKLTDLEDLPM